MTFGREPRLSFRILASTLLASLLVVLALAANPHWHEIAHGETSQEHCEHGHEDSEHDHEDGGHRCAVDLFTSGSVDHATPALISITVPTVARPVRLVATTDDVAAVFLCGSILEHAPPASV